MAITVSPPSTPVVVRAPAPVATIGAAIPDVTATPPSGVAAATMPIPVAGRIVQLRGRDYWYGTSDSGNVVVRAPAPAGLIVNCSVRYFAQGGVGPVSCVRIFNTESPPVAISLSRLFDVAGPVVARCQRLFNVLGALSVSLERRFDVVAYQAGSTVGVYLPRRPSFSTTLDGAVAAGATTIEVAEGTGLKPGVLFQLDSEDAHGLHAEYRAVQSLSGTTVTFEVPLGLAHEDGAAVQARSGFVQGVMVFDKEGNPLGLIGRFSVGAKRARNVSSISPSISIAIPSGHPDCLLLDDDRLAALQSDLGEPLWSGAMARSDSRQALVQRILDEPFVQFVGGPTIDFAEKKKITVADGTPAAAIYAAILAAHNAARSAVHEIVWESDLSGVKAHPGDFEFKGDTMDAVALVASRSQTEFMWRAEISPGVVQTDPLWGLQFQRAWTARYAYPHPLNSLILRLVTSDAFTGSEYVEGEAPTGTDLFDGPGGNLQAPQIIEDPTPIVNELTLTGQTTRIADLLPQWAQWAVHEITPSVHLVKDPGKYRRRADNEQTVDWTLTKAAQQALADKTLEYLWDLYRSFLRSVHDMEGRPFHEGWRYPGPSEYLESSASSQDALSRRAWRSRVQILERYAGRPVTGVMYSDETNRYNWREWLVVSYDRVTGIQELRAWPIPQIQGADIFWCTIKPGAVVRFYRLSGTRVVQHGGSGLGTFDNSGNPNGSGVAVAPWTQVVVEPGGRRISLRLIIQGVRQGVWWVDANDPGCDFASMSPGAAVDWGAAGQFISKMYDFEQLNVGKWDPRRDGVGALLPRRSVFWSQITTAPRWHRVSYGVGADASTQLITGISAEDTDFEVGSSMGFPDLVANAAIRAADPNRVEAVSKFDAQIEDGDAKEIVTVTGQVGSLWNVLRGQQGTTARIHEAGSTIAALPGEQFDGIHFPYSWPEGEAYAAALLAKMSKKQYEIVTNVVNRGDIWRSITLGSTHDVRIRTEGPPGGFDGSIRILGYAIDDLAGTWEVVGKVVSDV